MSTRFIDNKIGSKLFCVAQATKVLGDKWSPKLIVQLFNGPLHFSEIQNLTEGISPRSLNLKLSKLIKLGIVKKDQDMPHTHKTSYKLTQKGIDLFPILNDMYIWGQKYK